MSEDLDISAELGANLSGLLDLSLDAAIGNVASTSTPKRTASRSASRAKKASPFKKPRAVGAALYKCSKCNQPAYRTIKYYERHMRAHKLKG